MTIELDQTWLLGLAYAVWLLLATLLGRWTYRNTCRENWDAPGVIALLAFAFMPLTLVIWLCTANNDTKRQP